MTTEDIEAYSNPVRLSVATRESGSAAGPSTLTSKASQQLPLSERERLLKARKSNEIVRRKGEKWADKLMEETVDRETFKKAVSQCSCLVRVRMVQDWRTALRSTRQQKLPNTTLPVILSLSPYHPTLPFNFEII
jgi:hypothetical protein